MKKIICEVADNGGVILITDLGDGTTPNQFTALTTVAEGKTAFASILDGMTATATAPETAAAPETPAPVAPAPAAQAPAEVAEISTPEGSN